jgi:hypothetical protein
MKSNVGKIDRSLRIIVGALLVGGNFFNYYVLGNPYFAWANIGWIPLLTGVFSFCPAYLPFRLSTRKKVQETNSGAV